MKALQSFNMGGIVSLNDTYDLNPQPKIYHVCFFHLLSYKEIHAAYTEA